MSTTFAQLGVPDSICRALARRGITKPFDIQVATMADALAGRDICGRAPTGSGKTLAFGIPLVANNGQTRARPHQPTALVLAPTRELADQIMTELRSFSRDIRVAVVYGGVGYGNQLRSLSRGVDILVACPGRLEDLIDQGAVSLGSVGAVVIDEADRMADMGFIPAVRRLLDQTMSDRQTMLFSATLDGDVASLTRDYQHDPERCEVGDETPDVLSADHVFWNVIRTERTAVTAEAINATGSAIVFCRTRHGCNRLARQLDRTGIATAAIHGGRSQNQRTRALREFTAGRVQALIATDVAARGIHVEGIEAVIHYDAPDNHKTYLHRSGRTARAGRGGVVISLVPPEQARELIRMQRKLGIRQPITEVDKALLSPLGYIANNSELLKPATTSSRPQADSQQSGQPKQRSPRSKQRGQSKQRSPRSKQRGQSKQRSPRSKQSGQSKQRAAQSKQSGQSKQRSPQSKQRAAQSKQRSPQSKQRSIQPKRRSQSKQRSPMNA